MPFLRKLALFAAAFLFAAAGAHAIPIVYEFSGTVSDGSLNGVAFTDRTFIVEVFGDTSGVTALSGGVLVNPATSVTFSISGVGSGSFTDAYRVFLAPNFGVGFSHLPDGLDRIDVPVDAATLGGYALASAFGPVTAGFGDIFIGQFTPDATSAGLLEMIDGPSSVVTFRSFLPGAPVPAPATLLLAALGLLGLCLVRCKR